MALQRHKAGIQALFTKLHTLFSIFNLNKIIKKINQSSVINYKWIKLHSSSKIQGIEATKVDIV